MSGIVSLFNRGRPALQRATASVVRATRAAWQKRYVRRLLPPVAAIFFCATLSLIYIYFNRNDLPDLESFIRFEAPVAGHVYDANGEVLIELAKERRQIIEYKDLPQVVRDAILSAEDKNFFSHGGIDYSALPRVLSKTNLRSLDPTVRASDAKASYVRRSLFPQGGSTITQQLVRGYFLQSLIARENGNTLLHHGIGPRLLACLIGVRGANKLLRKVEEIRLSLWVEREMQKRFGSKRRMKEELLARYASLVYLGNGRYGFAAASDYYFGKPLASFTAQDADKAALLAGIIKSPREYAPTASDIQGPLRRRNQVLALMAANHFLSEPAAERLEQAPIRLAVPVRTSINVEAPAAVQNVLSELKGLGENLGVEQLMEGRIQVYSTVDNRIQRIVNTALENGLKAYEQRHPKSKGLIQGSVVVLRNRDAAVLAEAGGRRVYQDRSNSFTDFNRVTDSLRQPGSAMKPIVYLAAFRHGALSLDSRIPDEPIGVPDTTRGRVKWISNYDGEYRGMIPARQALAESRNAAAVWVAKQIGIDSVLRAARDLGIATPLQPYLTTALGASDVKLIDLANAYRTIASGTHAKPHAIDKIKYPAGDITFSSPQPCCPLDASDFAMGLIQEGLRGVVRLPGGTAHALSWLPVPVMGKTGTTSNHRDALFVGSTYGLDGITIAVRIGFDDNSDLGSGETGGRAALPVFREIILKVYQQKLVGPAPAFPKQIERDIDAYLSGEFDVPEHRANFAPATLPDKTKRPCGPDGGSSEADGKDAKDDCKISANTAHPIYRSTNDGGRVIYSND